MNSKAWIKNVISSEIITDISILRSYSSSYTAHHKFIQFVTPSLRVIIQQETDEKKNIKLRLPLYADIFYY